MAIALATIGFASIIAQVLLLRELVTVCNGNEITYGLSLMIWLLSGGIGGFFAGRALNRMEPFKTLIYLDLAVSILIPAEILFARFSKLFFNIPAGTLPDMNAVLMILAACLFPSGFLLAALFTVGCRALKDIGNMYILESLGALFGGIVFTFILVFFLGPFQVAGVTGLVLGGSALYIYKHYVRSGSSYRNGMLLIFSLVLAANLMLVYPIGQIVDISSSRAQFKGLKLVRSVDSIYGRIQIIEDKGERSYFENGSLMFSTASVAWTEELVHLSFLEASLPGNVLLIGGGLSGVIPEMYKYREMKELDYVEFDPKLLEVSSFSYPAKVTDGRHFIRTTGAKYDLIIVNVGDPVTAALNRFYTYEFMLNCRKILKPGGVLALHISASDPYMNKEMTGMNSSIFKTIELAFPRVVMVPGSVNHYFASDISGRITSNADELEKRRALDPVPAAYFNPSAIRHLADPNRIKDMREMILYGKATKLNTDLAPISYLYGILSWLSYSPTRFSRFIQGILDIELLLLLFLIAAFAVLCRFFTMKEPPVALAVGSVGGCAMILQLLSIYSFQAMYGSVYLGIGLLTALFMGGLAAGSFITNIKYPKSSTGTIICLLMVIIAGFMVYLFNAAKLVYLASQFMIPAFSFAFALLIGAFFPAAVRVHRSKNLQGKAGTLYGADLIGGAATAFFTSIWFVPAYGILGTCWIALALCLSSFVLIYRSS